MTLITKKRKTMATLVRIPNHPPRKPSSETKLESALDGALDQMTPEQIEEAEAKTNALLAELRTKR
jgi:hypothetical protein